MARVRKQQRGFDPALFDRFAQRVVDDHRTRKSKRKNLEAKWAEVDRQVAMENQGRADAQDNRAADGNSAWMPELELPLQSEALEVLCTDSYRLLFSDDVNWFRAHAALSDKFMKRWEASPLIGGDELEVPVRITQEAADRVTKAALNFFHRRYNFKARVNLLDAEAFKYGISVARGLMVREDKMRYDATGEKAIRALVPQLVPCSIKNVYLDDSVMQVAHEGMMIEPSFIRQFWQHKTDLLLAATIGAKDKDPYTGGWILSNFENIEGKTQGDQKDQVEQLEFEGDFVIDDQGESVYVPNVVITVVVQEGGPKIVRFRPRPPQLPFRSYIVGEYFRHDSQSAYAKSPCIDGVPIQKMTTEAANRLIQVAALQAEPPLAYDPNDWHLANAGGPRIYPGAQWPAMSKIETMEIGDLQGMLAVYQGGIKQFQDQSGVNDTRMGQSTQTHKTAFAVDQEMSRGVIRTVKYVNGVKEGPLVQFLRMELEMARLSMKREKQTVFVDEYEGFVEIGDEHLPDDCVFECIGASGGMEEQQEAMRKTQALVGLFQVEPMARQLGGTPIDVDKIRQEFLRENGFTDVSQFFQQPQIGAAGVPVGGPVGLPGGPPPGPALPGLAQGTPPNGLAPLVTPPKPGAG